MNYLNCKVLYELTKKDIPLFSKVSVDEFTDLAQECFDFEFNGESKFYPYELPNSIKNMKYDMLVICGASGKGKSTLLKEFPFYNKKIKQFDNSKAIISNFTDRDSAIDRLSSVGLSSIPTWCKPRNVLSVGEGFRADMALRLDNETIFDEFTSTIDRNVAKATCLGISKFISKNNLHNIVFCSCHKDFIDWLNPSIVIDLDEEKIFDCRNQNLSPLSNQSVGSILSKNGMIKVGEILL